MKTVSILAATAVLFGAAPAFAGDVTIELTGAQARSGKIFATLTGRDTFMKPGGMEQTVDPADGTVRIVFRDVPAGDYAFMAFHDENGDGRMAMGETGMPSEGWALSNADKLMGPPSFDPMKFAVPAEGATVPVPMIYPTPR